MLPCGTMQLGQQFPVRLEAPHVVDIKKQARWSRRAHRPTLVPHDAGSPCAEPNPAAPLACPHCSRPASANAHNLAAKHLSCWGAPTVARWLPPRPRRMRKDQTAIRLDASVDRTRPDRTASAGWPARCGRGCWAVGRTAAR